ncbi:Os07g0147700, partial [Oryza sativa Japonica Group]
STKNAGLAEVCLLITIYLTEQERFAAIHKTLLQQILLFPREIFPSHVKLFVENDAVAALASGTMGKLHGCVLIAGTGTIAYGFTRDGREARAAGAGPVLGDWGRSVTSSCT